MNKQSSYNTVNGGISLFLLTFIILCLVSFAALSIVSARADARLTEKYRQQTEYYYGARNEAQKFLQELDGGNDSAGADTSTGAGASAGAEVLRENAGADGLITRRFAAGPHMELILIVEPMSGGNSVEPLSGGNSSGIAGKTQDGPNYRVICEKTESTVTYNYDTTLPVMKR